MADGTIDILSAVENDGICKAIFVSSRRWSHLYYEVGDRLSPGEELILYGINS